MLSWVATFLVLSLVAAFFGFSGIAATTSDIAQILFFVFLVFFVVSLLMQFARKGDRALNKNL